MNFRGTPMTRETSVFFMMIYLQNGDVPSFSWIFTRRSGGLHRAPWARPGYATHCRSPVRLCPERTAPIPVAPDAVVNGTFGTLKWRYFRYHISGHILWKLFPYRDHWYGLVKSWVSTNHCMSFGKRWDKPICYSAAWCLTPGWLSVQGDQNVGMVKSWRAKPESKITCFSLVR